MESMNPQSRWLRPSLIGVLLIAALPFALFFASLFDHGRTQPMMQVLPVERDMMMQSDVVGNSIAMPMSGDAYERGEMGMMKAAPATPEATLSGTTERAVATRATLDLRVQSIDWTMEKIREVVLGRGGYIESSNVSQPQFSERTAWVVVKVPAKDFQASFDELKKNLFSVIGETMSGTDMTLAVTDLRARLANKQAEEASLQGLLSRATDISDIIKITDRLTQVRSEIESLQGQERYLNDQTEMASLSISMTEDPQVVADTGNFESGNIFKVAINELVRAMTKMGSGLVVLLVAGVPIILVYLFILWTIYFFAKKGVNKFFDR